MADERFLAQLWATIESRKAADDGAKTSYTRELLAKPSKIRRKVMEEAYEVNEAHQALESGQDSKDHLAHEAADLLYHLLVLLAHTTMERTVVEQLNPSLTYRIGKSIPAGDPFCELGCVYLKVQPSRTRLQPIPGQHSRPYDFLRILEVRQNVHAVGNPIAQLCAVDAMLRLVLPPGGVRVVHVLLDALTLGGILQARNHRVGAAFAGPEREAGIQPVGRTRVQKYCRPRIPSRSTTFQKLT